MSKTAGCGVTLKRVLLRLAILLLTGLGLLVAVLLFTTGLLEANLLRLVGGFLGIVAGGGILVVLVLSLLRRRTSMSVPLVAGLVLAGGLAVYLAITTQVPVGAACYGQGVATAANYDGGPGPHPVEAVHNGRRIWSPPSASWRPASTEETELVACAGPLERYVIETCQYVGGPSVTRYGYQRMVTLVVARTGEALATETFKGAAPRKCAQTEERSVRSLKGEKQIDPDELWDWLSAWVVPAESQAPGPDSGEPHPQAPGPSPTPEPLPVGSPAPTEPASVEEAQPAPEIRPEPTRIWIETPEAAPQVIVTPGRQPPETAVTIGSPSLWSGPDHQGEHMGIILSKGETVEILASTKEWTQVRWVSAEGEEVIGWVLSQFLGKP